ncbi:hypothetical protein ADUPG1_007237, partial [Aduncisulcus paluster]
KDNRMADFLSRLNEKEEIRMNIKSLVRPEIKSTLKDRIIRAQSSLTDTFPQELNKFDEFWRDEDGKIFIPDKADELKNELVDLFHAHVLGGHFGKKYTAERIREAGFFWKGLNNFVKSRVDKCLICMKNKPLLAPSVMGTIMKKEVFEEISIDSLGPITKEEENPVKYIIVIIDNFSRFVELYPTESTTGKEAADAVLNCIVARHGLPKCIRTDAGPQYKNELIHSLCEALNRMVIVERVNREIWKHLKTGFTRGLRRQDWPDMLPLIMNILNNRKSENWKYSPHELMYGSSKKRNQLITALVERDDSRPFSSFTEEEQATVFDKHIEILDKRLKKRRKTVEEEQEKALDAREKRLDDADGPKEFGEGDLVLLTRQKQARKGQSLNLGPYKVIKKTSKFYYRVEGLNGEKPFKVHISRMRECDVDEDEETLKSLQATDEEEFELDRIISHTGRGKRTIKFVVRWKGYEEDQDSELAFKELKDCEVLD